MIYLFNIEYRNTQKLSIKSCRRDNEVKNVCRRTNLNRPLGSRRKFECLNLGIKNKLGKFHFSIYLVKLLGKKYSDQVTQMHFWGRIISV